MNHKKMSMALLTAYALFAAQAFSSMCMSHATKPCEQYTFQKYISTPPDKKIILVGGCFDILHFGHITFLEKAKELGDYLVIALEPDERITDHKHRAPTHTQAERAHNLLALQCVDKVIMLPALTNFDDYNDVVQLINPDVIAITANDPQHTNKEKQAASIKAQCIVVTPRIGTFSSSAIYQSYNKDPIKEKPTT